MVTTAFTMIDHRKSHLVGQVLVEFTLAAVGLTVLAFVTARVAQWMNQSLVERNSAFQTTRLQAGQASNGGLVRFNGPSSDIHLIGPRAESVSRAGPQSSGPSAGRISCPQGDALLAQGQAARSNAQSVLQQGEANRTQVADLLTRARQHVINANGILLRIPDTCGPPSVRGPVTCSCGRRCTYTCYYMDCGFYQSCAANQERLAVAENQRGVDRAREARTLALTLSTSSNAVQSGLASAEDNERRALVECGRR